MAENFLDGTGATPVSYWMFEDASGPALDGNTTNTNDLPWVGNVARSTTHKEGAYSASVPDGSSALQATHASLSANFPFKGAVAEFTIGGWIYTPFDGAQTQMFLQYSDNDLTTGEGFDFWLAQGKPRVRVFSTGGDVTLTAVNAVPAGPAWHHVMARWNGNNTAGAGANDEISLWVNGTQEATTGTATSVAVNTSGAAFQFYDGGATVENYDEWFVFDVALTDTQMLGIYQDGLVGRAAAVTGTATASITETDIVTGGKTIIITLTGDTWIAA
jgi:hypothetical protein